ncbi:hypothetical protein [Inquilinus limosus]|uniref:hypothetical protein n=1 Tax=Inquilinus limosus TaxID=171674 RepID=UPI00041513BF|nr:hypothetical protein [Inquilinus limosus]
MPLGNPFRSQPPAQPEAAGTGAPQAPAEAAAPPPGSPPPPPPPPPVSTNALNQQVVQAVGFANQQTAAALPQLVQGPPEVMVTEAAGLAVQDATSYMNAVMQIALAVQAVVAKRMAENPEAAETEAPVLEKAQAMVAKAVEVFGTVSSTAGTGARTFIGDLS